MGRNENCDTTHQTTRRVPGYIWKSKHTITGHYRGTQRRVQSAEPVQGNEKITLRNKSQHNTATAHFELQIPTAIIRSVGPSKTLVNGIYYQGKAIQAGTGVECWNLFDLVTVTTPYVMWTGRRNTLRVFVLFYSEERM